jgi:hypothetical protein
MTSGTTSHETTSAPNDEAKHLSPIGFALRFQRAYNDHAAFRWMRKNTLYPTYSPYASFGGRLRIQQSTVVCSFVPNFLT